jgi:predicted enzyme related to lactoylglutathione lyase
MAAQYGQFCWYELITPDPDAALKFYGEVVGWTAKQVPPNYTMLEAQGSGVGGVMALTEEMRVAGLPPCWTGYVLVEDVDASVAKLQALSGALRREPADIPNVGRFAVATDPQGAVFLLFQTAQAQATQAQATPEADPAALGACGWRELMAGDGAKAFAFYSEMFGWTKDHAVDMGAMGTYQTFATHGRQSGGMMTMPPQCPSPHWGYYFNVDSAEAAAARITGAGGTVQRGPMEVPGGQWVVQAVDPQGAHFALVAPKR